MDKYFQNPVITIAKKVLGTEDVVAIDLYFNSISSVNSTAELPKNSNYFMCDSKGKLLYGVLSKLYAPDYTGNHVLNLYHKILDVKHTSALSYTYGLDQKNVVFIFMKWKTAGIPL